MEGLFAYGFEESIVGSREASKTSKTSKSPSSLFGDGSSNIYHFEDLLANSGDVSSGGVRWIVLGHKKVQTSTFT